MEIGRVYREVQLMPKANIHRENPTKEAGAESPNTAVQKSSANVTVQKAPVADRVASQEVVQNSQFYQDSMAKEATKSETTKSEETKKDEVKTEAMKEALQEFRLEKEATRTGTVQNGVAVSGTTANTNAGAISAKSPRTVAEEEAAESTGSYDHVMAQRAMEHAKERIHSMGKSASFAYDEDI